MFARETMTWGKKKPNLCAGAEDNCVRVRARTSISSGLVAFLFQDATTRTK